MDQLLILEYFYFYIFRYIRQMQSIQLAEQQ
jgi:hypothetical protein